MYAQAPNITALQLVVLGMIFPLIISFLAAKAARKQNSTIILHPIQSGLVIVASAFLVTVPALFMWQVDHSQEATFSTFAFYAVGYVLGFSYPWQYHSRT